MLPSPLAAFTVAAAACMTLLLARLRWGPRGRIGSALALAFGLAMGFVWAVVQGQAGVRDRLPAEWEGSTLWAEGWIDDIPRIRGGVARFALRIDRLDDGVVNHRLRVTWYRPGQVPAAGQRWRLPLRLRATRGFRNPDIFDYEGWLIRQGFDGRASVRGDGAQLLSEEGGGPRAGLARVRERIGTAIAQRLAGRPEAGLVRALVVGDRQGLSDEQWSVLRRTGTGHLMAISGLHVSLLAGIVVWLVRRLWGPWGTLLPAPVVAAAAGLAVATVYAALAGFALPVQRALIMLAVVLGTVILRRPLVAGQGLSLALLLVLLLDPLAVGAPGFWLSFGAVGAILLALAGRPARGNGRWRGLGRWTRIQWTISLLLVPLGLYWFGQGSLVSPLVNMLAIPVVGMLVVPLSLVGATCMALPPVGEVLLTLAAQVFAVLWQGLELAAQPAWAVLRDRPPGLAIGFALIGAAWFLMPRGLPGRGVAPLCLLPLFLSSPRLPAAGQFTLTALDVGQGQAIVIRTGGHTLVYDSGPRFRSGFDTGAGVVVPWLRARGVRALDRLIISHSDTDHAGGTASILAAFPGTRLYAGEPLPDLEARPCHAGQRWQWDDVRFQVLWPRPEIGVPEGNNSSCVLRVIGRDRSVLLTGDIEASVERRLVARAPDTLRADLVLAAHHGSATSSTPRFITATAATQVLFSAGYRNRFGFPKADVLDRWLDAGAEAWITGLSGALNWDSRDGRMRPWVRDGRRFWHGPPFGARALTTGADGGRHGGGS
ncbi:MAG: DNA internalization-related competence protein ComEC/Rec2 [Gammaproteobacteria bacterium]